MQMLVMIHAQYTMCNTRITFVHEMAKFQERFSSHISYHRTQINLQNNIFVQVIINYECFLYLCYFE